MKVRQLAERLGVRPQALVRFLEEWVPREDGKRWDIHHELTEFHKEVIKEYFTPKDYNKFKADKFALWIEEALNKKKHPYVFIKPIGFSRVIIEIESVNGETIQINVSERGFMLEAKSKEVWKWLYDRLYPFKEKLRGKGFYMIPEEKIKPSRLGTYGVFYLHYNSPLYIKIYESESDFEIKEGIRKTLDLIYNFLIKAEVVKAHIPDRFILHSLYIENFRRLKFEKPVLFDKANVIVGENDSGKTSLLFGVLFYLKALKMFAENLDNLYVYSRRGKDEYRIYVSREFFAPIFGLDTFNTIKALIWRRHVVGDKVNARISFEGQFKSIDDEIDFTIRLRIGYENKTLHLQVDAEDLAYIKRFREFLRKINIIYIEKSVSPKNSEIYVGKGKDIMPYILKNLYEFKHDDIIRTLAFYFEERINDITDEGEISDYFNILEITPQQDRWKQSLFVRYEDIDIDNADLKDEKDVKRFCMDMGIKHMFSEFEDYLAKNIMSLSGEEYVKEFKKYFKEHPINLEEKHYIEISNVGQGLKDIIYLTLLIYFLRSTGPSFLLMDEPFLHMHPNLKSKTADYIISLCSRFNIQVFYTTHDPRLIPDGKTSTSFVIVDKKEKSVVRNEVSIENIFKFLETLGYIEILSRRSTELVQKRKLLLVEGFSDKNLLELIFSYKPEYRQKLDEYFILPISSAEVVPMLPMFFGSIIPIIFAKTVYRYKDFKKKFKEVITNSIILLDADYKAPLSMLYKSYEDWIGGSVSRFFSTLTGYDSVEVEAERSIKPLVRVLPYYSMENLVLVPSFLKAVFNMNPEEANERLIKHITKNEDTILEHIKHDIIKLKNYIQNSEIESSHITSFYEKIEQVGIEGIAYECLNKIKTQPLKFYKGKSVLSVLSDGGFDGDIVKLTERAIDTDAEVAKDILKNMELLGLKVTLLNI